MTFINITYMVECDEDAATASWNWKPLQKLMAE